MSLGQRPWYQTGRAHWSFLLESEVLKLKLQLLSNPIILHIYLVVKKKSAKFNLALLKYLSTYLLLFGRSADHIAASLAPVRLKKPARP